MKLPSGHTLLRSTASKHSMLTVSKNRHHVIANKKIMDAQLPCGKGLPREKYLSDGKTVCETLAYTSPLYTFSQTALRNRHSSCSKPIRNDIAMIFHKTIMACLMREIPWLYMLIRMLALLTLSVSLLTLP